MKILLVDDEPHILEGLRMLLDRHFPEHEIYSFRSAMQALQFVRTRMADIVISDINMNEMSGLDMIQQIRTLCPAARVLVISGHDDFSYAKRAIDLDVVSYILKPVNQTALTAILSKTIEAVEQDIRKNQDAQLNTKDAQKKVLTDLIKHGFQEINLNTRIQRLNLDRVFESYFVGSLSIQGFHLLTSMDHSIQFSNLHLFLEQIIEIEIEKIPSCECFYAEPTRGEYLFVTDSCKAELVAFLMRVTQKIKENFQFDCVVGTSSHMTSDRKLFYAYHEAKGFSLSGDKGILGEDKRAEFELSTFIEKSMSNFDDILSCGDFSRLNSEISFCLNYLSINYYEHSDSVRFCRALYEKLTKFFGEKLHENWVACQLDETECENVLKFIPRFEALQNQIKLMLLRRNQNIAKQIIQQTKDLIDKDYTNVTLYSAADSAHINYVYLSIIFKEQTGENFKDYVMRFKIEKAKTLLTENNRKIYEIAQSVGYSDIKYFSRIFKKFTGLLPNEYRAKEALSNCNVETVTFVSPDP